MKPSRETSAEQRAPAGERSVVTTPAGERSDVTAPAAGDGRAEQGEGRRGREGRRGPPCAAHKYLRRSEWLSG
ncbi:hypothetical protein GCM10020220_111120 [Nonomuraea rubra]